MSYKGSVEIEDEIFDLHSLIPSADHGRRILGSRTYSVFLHMAIRVTHRFISKLKRSELISISFFLTNRTEY